MGDAARRGVLEPKTSPSPLVGVCGVGPPAASARRRCAGEAPTAAAARARIQTLLIRARNLAHHICTRRCLLWMRQRRVGLAGMPGGARDRAYLRAIKIASGCVERPASGSAMLSLHPLAPAAVAARRSPWRRFHSLPSLQQPPRFATPLRRADSVLPALQLAEPRALLAATEPALLVSAAPSAPAPCPPAAAAHPATPPAWHPAPSPATRPDGTYQVRAVR
jgi:hypothetical protein